MESRVIFGGEKGINTFQTNNSSKKNPPAIVSYF
jgi:hypothetical protein